MCVVCGLCGVPRPRIPLLLFPTLRTIAKPFLFFNLYTVVKGFIAILYNPIKRSQAQTSPDQGTLMPIANSNNYILSGKIEAKVTTPPVKGCKFTTTKEKVAE